MPATSSVLMFQTSSEIARMAKISQRAVNLAITNGKLLPSAKAGIVALFTDEDVGRWLTSRGGPGRQDRHAKKQANIGQQQSVAV